MVRGGALQISWEVSQVEGTACAQGWRLECLACERTARRKVRLGEGVREREGEEAGPGQVASGPR